jgi:hypothetical protein
MAIIDTLISAHANLHALNERALTGPSIALLLEGDLVELQQDHLVKSLTEPVNLWLLYLCPCMIDIVEG